MTESRPTPKPPIDPRPSSAIADGGVADESRGRRTRIAAAFGLATAVALIGVGGQTLAGAANGGSSDDSKAPATRAAQASDELGDRTLDELADELADLGLTLRIEPSADDAEETETDRVDTEGDEADVNDSNDDPFADYSDAEFDALSDGEFDQILQDSGWAIDDEGYLVPESEAGGSDSGGVDQDGEQGDFGDDEVLGAFSADGDTLDTSGASSPEVARQSQEIWDRFIQLIPADQRQMLTGFELNPEEASGAYVYPNDADPSTWTMGVSLGLGEDLDYVLIHEFGHLLTLQANEVPPAPDADPDSCPTYFTGEGCALSGTTMAQFVERFWPASQVDEVNRLQEAEDYDGLDAFYEANRDDFVTDYATTNPAEDLAETFTVFVLNDRPTGDTIADQKVNLLWGDADMVALREQIRANR